MLALQKVEAHGQGTVKAPPLGPHVKADVAKTLVESMLQALWLGGSAGKPWLSMLK